MGAAAIRFQGCSTALACVELRTMTTSYQLAVTAAADFDCTNAGWTASQGGLDTSRLVMQALAIPFDAVRTQYASAAKAGLIERSMLAQRDFERSLGAAERLMLGPWARRV